MRAPINTILQFSDVLQRQLKDARTPNTDQVFSFIREAGQRMQRLIENLLNYATVMQSSGEQAEAVPAASSCRSVLKDLAAVLQETNAQVTCEIDDTVQVRIVASQLQQVFQNLISNAIHYRRPDTKPVITVRVENHVDQWRFAVADNGEGIEEGHLEKIFVAFNRLHGQERPGSGMGLATCRRIVEGRQGKIWVKSKVGVGSTFYFLLPRAEPQTLTAIG